MLCSGSPKAVFTPHWDGTSLCSRDLQQMLIFAELSLRSCQLWEEKGRRAGPCSGGRSPLEKSLELVLRHGRAQRAPLALLPEHQLLSQGDPWSEQRVRAPTATHTWGTAASHKTVQKQEKSPMNAKLKKAAVLMSIFGMNWRILLFQLQPTCWFSSAALLFCSFPLPELS